jgi:undecaprenyl-diphosphatase
MDGARRPSGAFPPEYSVPLVHLAVLALVQGITEFLPISSSAHLILAPHLFGWEDQGRTIDVAVHVGTLLAVMLYAWRDIADMLAGLWQMVRGRSSAGLRLALQIVLATVPVIVAGVLMVRYVGDALRAVEVIAWATIGFGVLLWIADRVGMTVRRIEHLTYLDAFLVGLAQALALIPGTSRSGITMTMGRMLGMERTHAARFSLLLGIPAILAAGTVETLGLIEQGDMALGLDALIGAALSFVAALVSIVLMMAWLQRASFTPFVIYRLLLGGGLLWWIYG